MIPKQTPETDLLAGETFVKKERRSGLMPWWFHVWQVVLLLIMNYFVGFIVRIFDRDAMIMPAPIAFLLTLIGICTVWLIIGFVLIWCRWKYAIAFTLAPAVIYSNLAVIGTLGSISAGEIAMGTIAVLSAATFVGYTIRLFIIRKAWKERIR